MALTSTVKTDLYRFFAVAFDAAPGVTYMNQLADAVNSGMTVQQIVEVFTTKTQFTSVYPTFYTNEQFAAKLMNTVAGDSATAEAKAEAAADIVAALALGGEWTRGKVIYTIFNNLANKATDDATWGNTSKQMANQVAYAQYYTEELLGDATDMSTLRAVIASVTETTSTETADMAAALTPAVAAQTFTLTTGSNTFTGTSGNDTFDGGLSTGGLQTLNSGDRLDGGLGTDELTGVITASATPTALTSIETVTITSTAAAGATFDASNATTIATLSSQGTTGAFTLSGIAKTVSVNVQDTTQAHTVVYNNVTGTADAATIGVKNVTAAPGITVAGVETLTFNSVGSTDNNLGTPVTAAATTINVTGTAGLSLGTLGTTVTKLDASALASVTNVGVTAITSTTSASTITGSAGNDTITLGASGGNDSVDGGALNDTIIFTANFTVADSINGGDGTADALRAINADLVTASAATPTTYTVTNVETIQSTTTSAGGVSITPGNISATATRLNLAHATGTNVTGAAVDTIVGGAGSFTLGLGSTVAATGTLGAAIVVNDTGTATTDSLTILNSEIVTGTGLNANVYNNNNITVNGYETVTIGTGSVAASAAQTIGTVTVTGDVGGTSAETVNFSGANTLTVGVITADIVNASAMTAAGTAAAPTITMTAGSTATTVTGSAGIDVLVGAATTASSVDGGAGNDTLTGGTAADTLIGGDGQDTLNGAAGNDSLVGGAGNDSINAGAGNDNIDGGAGNDTVDMDGNLASGDVVVGGDDTGTTDVLILTGQAVSPTAAEAAGVSGFETLTLDGTAVTAVTMSNFISNTFTRVNANLQGGVAVAVTGAGTAVTTLGMTNVNDNAATVSLGRLVDTTTNSLSLAIGLATSTDGVQITQVTVDDEETVTIASSGLTGGTVNQIATLQARDSTGITITGAKDLTIGTVDAVNATTGVGTLTSLDLSAVTGAVSVGLTFMTNDANMTILGAASVASSVSGGTGNDTITGGIGDDSLLGGGGADSLSGAAGNDTLTGGTGADAIVGGDGTDTFSAVGMNVANVDGTAGTSTGALINLGATAITSAVATAAMGTVFGVSSNIGTVAANTAVYVYANTATAGSSAVDTLSGIENAVGTTGTDYIVGSATANVIDGGTGADTINGGAGADTITGGAGVDSLTGGLGSDDFIQTVLAAGGVEVDVITDLSLAQTDQVGNFGLVDLANVATLTTLRAATTDVAVGAISTAAGDIGAALDLGAIAAGVNLLLTTGNYANAAAVQVAVRANVLAGSATTAAEGFLIAWDNGVSTTIGIVDYDAIEADGDATDAATVTAILTLTGITDNTTLTTASGVWLDFVA